MGSSVYNLSIDGVALPSPKKDGVTVTEEKVWSSNTGRSASAKMLGTLVAIKTTVKIDWPDLSPAQAALIRSVVSNPSSPFSLLKYTDIDGNTVEKTVYFGTPTYTIRTIRGGGRVANISVSGIEQ